MAEPGFHTFITSRPKKQLLNKDLENIITYNIANVLKNNALHIMSSLYSFNIYRFIF